jgi:flagellar biosynthesis/type III secretory pathway chaperone
MLNETLNQIILKESKALKDLLALLEEQHSMILKNDIFGLEAIVEKIQNCNREIAKEEVERRKLVGSDGMSKTIDTLGDEELDRNFRSIKKLLAEVELQKDTNELLIRQGLGFTSRMLNILNPDRNVKTYNSYGKMGR